MPKKQVTYTRSIGAKSGVESYFIAMGIVAAFTPILGIQNEILFVVAMFLVQLAVMSDIDRDIIFTFCCSQKYGVTVMRNASIGFAECVRPGGKPTMEHCLNIWHLPGVVSSVIFLVPAVLSLAVGPVLAAVRCCYPEHAEGVNKGRYLRLWWLFVRHPMVIQGEGPSNGDGLAAMNGSESVIYPVTKKNLEQGPRDKAYWKEEGRPRLRDMFHDKLFCHRFFEEHGAPHPIPVAEVKMHKRREILLTPEKAPKDLVWKPRYSTMGLGVEKFQGWDGVDNGTDWAPSDVPYVLEEFIQATEYDHSEWYRMTTLWAHDAKEPKCGYCWRTRNPKGDKRVQTDIIGGAYCVTAKHTPFVGPKEKSTVVDPRTGKKGPLDPKVEKALTRAIDLQKEMHKHLGQELHSIGWDVMVRGEEPIFIEFNINNGFFVADHSVEEVEEMIAYYGENFKARKPKQLTHFNPE